MAQISISSGSIMRPYRSPWGAFPVQGYPLSTGVRGSTIQPGYLVTSDTTTDSNADKIQAADTLSTAIVGVALEAASGNSTGNVNSTISVAEANPAVEFRAFTKGDAMVSSLIGKTRSYAFDSTLRIYYVDLANATTADARVVITRMGAAAGLQGALGDTGGECAFRFLRATAVADSVSTASHSVLAYYK